MAMSPLELPAAKIGRRPTRPQMRTGFTGPSSRNSGRLLVRSCPSVKSRPTELPITRSGGMPYIRCVTGRMKSRPPPEAM